MANDSFKLKFASDGHMRFNATPEGGSEQNAPTSAEADWAAQDAWVFFAATYDGTASSANLLYYSGSTTQAVALEDTLDFNLGQLRIDGNSRLRISRQDRPYAGLVDNIRVYDQVLTLADLETVRAGDLVVQHAGDANGDGMVNLSDLQILGDNWQSTTASWAQADFTGDGVVNLSDLQILGDNWGYGTESDVSFDQALSGIVIPEPATFALLGCTALLVLRRGWLH